MRAAKLTGRPRLASRSITGSICLSLATLAASLGLGAGMTAGSASAATAAQTDVLLVFDTSSSMEGALAEAKSEISGVMGQIELEVPNVDFGVAEVRDYPLNEDASPEQETEARESTEKPWKLDQPITPSRQAVEEAIAPLQAEGGGDLPESYGRALYESSTNPNVGWRPGARHLIVLIADNVPHDHNLNEGIAESEWAANEETGKIEDPFDTGEEKPGRWAIPGTQWTPSVNVEFHATLAALATNATPLELVSYHGAETGYVRYWEHWAEQTGGRAVEAASGALAGVLTSLVKESAGVLPPCPAGQVRTAAESCVTPPPPTNPPVERRSPIVIEGSGEIEWEVEFPEAGEAEYEAEVHEGAELELARIQGLALLDPLAPAAGHSPQGSLAARNGRHRKKKPRRCKKGFVKKHRRCVSNAPLHYGKGRLAVPSAGVYEIRIKPSGKVLRALRRGRTAKVRLELAFTPAGTTVHIAKTASVRLHLKLEKKHKKARKGKGRKRRKK